MKTTRPLFAFLALLLSLSILAGCGGPREITPVTPTTSETTTRPVETEPTTAAEPTTEDPSAEPWDGTLIESSIEETVIFNDKGVKITALELSFDSFSPELTLEFENKTGTNLVITTGFLAYSGGTSINGYMLDVYETLDIAAGKKVRGSLRFFSDELALMGITQIAEIELGFHIREEADRERFFVTGPLLLKTSSADHLHPQDAYRKTIVNKEVQEFFDYGLIHFSDKVSYDKEGIRILSGALVTQEDDTLLFLEVENSSKEHIYFTTRTLFLNGLLVDDSTLSGEFINPGRRKIVTLDLTARLSQNYADLFGVGEIGEVIFSVALQDGANNTKADLEELVITVPGNRPAYDDSGREVYKKDGIRIVYKGLLPDEFAFIDDFHLLLLVENKSRKDIWFTDPYDALSVNDSMIDYFLWDMDVPAGKAAVLDIDMDYDSLVVNGISEIEDVRLIEMAFEVLDNDYEVIARPKISISY